MTSTLTVEPLTAIDRCDRCGAQAYLRATLPTGNDLLFCAHHGREYTPKLRELDALINDQSERLDENQVQASAAAGAPAE